jgi:serine/threonine protein kinase
VKAVEHDTADTPGATPSDPAAAPPFQGRLRHPLTRGSVVAIKRITKDVDILRVANEVYFNDVMFSTVAAPVPSEEDGVTSEASSPPRLVRLYDVYLDVVESKPDLIDAAVAAVDATTLRSGKLPSVICGWKVILDLCRGPELFDLIIDRGAFSEAAARVILRSILTAVNMIHQRGILIRDIRPEVLVFETKATETPQEESALKFVSLKFASTVGAGRGSGKPGELVGSPQYIAPEILRGFVHTKASDVWSCGVLAYILLSGVPPFSGASDNDIFSAVQRGPADFGLAEFEEVSADGKALLRDMLNVTATKRPSAEQLLSRQWFA